MNKIDVRECCYYNSNEVYPCELYQNNCEDQNCYFQQLQQLKQENEKLKKEIKLTKEMLIQNDNSTDWETTPQIIEEFMDNNLLDKRNEEGYTIPVFYQIEDRFEILETAEQKLEKIKSLVIVLQNICPPFVKDGNDSIKVINEILEIIETGEPNV